MRLEGKIAVITGAGSGMGRAMAELFSAEGAKIVAAEWNETTLAEVVDAVKASGGEAVGVQGDVSKDADDRRIIDEAVAAFGRIDVLCNNAGVMDLNAGAAELDDTMWRRVLGINLDGPMFLTRAAVPVMIKTGGGSIVNTASLAGLGGGAAGAAYTVSKHGVIGLTRNTAYRYGPEGIRCNAIAAGAVQTNIMQSVDPTKMDQGGLARSQLYYQMIPAQLEAIDIAKLALFLASDDARFINGDVVVADAGWRSA